MTKLEYIEKHGEAAWEKYRERYKFSLEKCIAKYGEAEGTKKYHERIENDKRKGTLAGYISRYGEIDGPLKYLEKNSKLSIGKESLTKRGYTEQDIKEIRDAHAKKSAHNLENFISRYGENEGREKYQIWKANSKKRTHLNVEYWIKKGFTEQEAKKLLKERQTTSTLEKFISRHGVEEGTKKYIELNERKTRKIFGTSVSKLEVAFFDALSKITNINQNGRSCKLRFNERSVVCDYLDTSIRKIIEINGDFWHMNPNQFKPHDINIITKRTAQDIWDFEANRTQLLENNGYEVLTIWESEINNDFDKSLTLAKTFLES